jgi:hypothetical protein
MSVTKYPGKWPHTQWIDLKNNGVMVECAVLKEDNFGNVYYVELASLDGIDRDRVSNMIRRPRANEVPLWETMAGTTLRNGVNALEYFHQLVKIITPEGVIMNPRVGAVGTGRVDTVDQQKVMEAAQQTAQGEDRRTPAEKRAETIAKRKAEAEGKE